MKILLIGNGGREHAIAWKLKQSPQVEAIICPNGNPGIRQVADVPKVSLSSPEDWAEYAAKEKIDLVVVGPEIPLAEGVTDACQAKGIKVFGPTQAAAQLEASKAFSKDVMAAAGIPTAKSDVFTSVPEALEFGKTLGLPIVVKADGLAAGKGVAICEDFDSFEKAVRENLDDNRFGESSSQVLVEQFLDGEETSILAFCDGKDVYPLVPSQDHKRAFDGDKGPNTGGMGTYAPAPVATEEILAAALGQVLRPAVEEMAARGCPYVGILYAGLMVLPDGGISVLEFNCRFGDPETQVVLPLLDGDLAELMLACAEGRLGPLVSGMEKDASGKRKVFTIRPESAACVVMASGGYPGSYETGKEISGLDQVTGDDCVVFHAGTKGGANGEVLTAGGRVLGVTAWASTLQAAVEKAYKIADIIQFDGAFYRHDIAHRALNRGKD